jgi:hypothetical protein
MRRARRSVGTLSVALSIVAASMGCANDGGPTGVVSGRFSLPGRPAADVQRGGLNFSPGSHGHGNGRTAKVDGDGAYSISLPPDTYTVIGGLAGRGSAPAESCAETISVVVIASRTTHADFVCHATPPIGG